MLIPGIPDDHLEWTHTNYAGGEGAIGGKHLPSGIAVRRECAGELVTQVRSEIVADLQEQLHRAGVISDENNMSAALLSASTVQLRSGGESLTLQFHGRTRPEAQDYWDANWLHCTA